MTYYISNDYLAHHGVKGMHWGVRKQIQAMKSRHSDRSLRRKMTRSVKKTEHDATKSAVKISRMAAENYRLLAKGNRKMDRHPYDKERNVRIGEKINRQIDRKVEKENQRMLKYLKLNYNDVSTKAFVKDGREYYQTTLKDKYGNRVVATTAYESPVARIETTYAPVSKKK